MMGKTWKRRWRGRNRWGAGYASDTEAELPRDPEELMGRFTDQAARERQERKHDGPVAAVDSALENEYPALYDFLTTSVTSDALPRKTATLMLFAEQGSFKACLHDRQDGRSFFRAAPTWDGVLEAVERALAEGTGDWRYSNGETSRRRG
jgi:hypothetical protein